MFEQQVFESLEINPAKKIYKINGEDFGKYCEKYEIEISQEGSEIAVVFRRHGTVKFANKYDARSGKSKSHFQADESDL